MNHDIAKQDLLVVKKIFDELNLPLLLVYGTALGAYRDGDFLNGDRDIDLATFGEANKERIWDKLKDAGFIKREGVKDQKGRTDFRSLHVNRQVPFDIFLFEKYGDKFKAYSTDDACCAELPVKFSATEDVQFLGETFKIPAPADEYLKYSYGDWRNKENRNSAR